MHSPLRNYSRRLSCCVARPLLLFHVQFITIVLGKFMKHYVSNKNETVRMFENDLLESFSRVHPATPLALYVPAISYLVYYGFTTYPLILSHFLTLFAAGLFVWTLTEYTLHRFVFHFVHDSRWGRRAHFIFHGVHHDYPNDTRRLVMPPSVSIPLAAFFYVLFRLLLGPSLVAPFFAGFLTGYLFYDMTHYAVHHFPIKGRVFSALRRHHLLHHFQQPDRGFGVSSPLWDHVFGTSYDQPPSV